MLQFCCTSSFSTPYLYSVIVAVSVLVKLMSTYIKLVHAVVCLALTQIWRLTFKHMHM